MESYFFMHVVRLYPTASSANLGTTHTAEIPFVFGNLDNSSLPNGTYNVTTSELDISDNMISAWTAMAATGDPSSGNGLQWPSYNASQLLGIDIDTSTTVGIINYTAWIQWYSILQQAMLPQPLDHQTPLYLHTLPPVRVYCSLR
jgi:carboxylesterase type B